MLALFSKVKYLHGRRANRNHSNNRREGR